MTDMQGTKLAKEKKRDVPYLTLSHDAVNEAISPLLVKHGILAVPNVISERMEVTTATTRDGREYNQFVTRAVLSVTFINIDNPEEREAATVFGDGIDSSDKGPGKAISYAVKYAYLKTFGLETTDDAENQHIERGASAPRQASKPVEYTGWDGTKVITGGKNEGKMWKDLSDRSIDFYVSEKFGDGPFKDAARAEKARRAGKSATEPKKLSPEEQIVALIKQEGKRRGISKERFAELMAMVSIEGGSWTEIAAQNDRAALQALLENVESEPLNLEEDHDEL